MTELCKHSDDKELGLAAFVALVRVHGVHSGSNLPSVLQVLGELPAGEVKAVEEKLNYGDKDFTDRYKHAEEELFPPEPRRGGGGVGFF